MSCCQLMASNILPETGVMTDLKRNFCIRYEQQDALYTLELLQHCNRDVTCMQWLEPGLHYNCHKLEVSTLHESKAKHTYDTHFIIS